MEALSETEREIIRGLLRKEYGPRSPLLDQLAGAGVENREFTGGGVFVSLRIAADAPAADRLNREISDGFRTMLAPPGDLVGFTLFIRHGYLDFLEGYMFGSGDWPGEPPDGWLIPRPVGTAGQKAG